MKKSIAYYRVSTDRQGQSGLGLAAQQKSVQDFAKSSNLNVVKEFTEIESGRKVKRPVLQKALQECKKENMVLLIARLDRLGRNVMFISTLIESKVEFIAIDNPHILAAVAQYEQRQISIRTKEALQAAKKRGVELGKNGKYVLAKQNSMAAFNFALMMENRITKLRQEGFTTVREIKRELNRRRVPTYRGLGFKWHNQTVHNVMTRIENKQKNLLNTVYEAHISNVDPASDVNEYSRCSKQ